MGATENERNQTSTSHLAQPPHHTPIPPHSHTLLFLSLAFFLTFLGAGAFQQYVKPLHEQLHLTSQQAAWVLSTIYLSFLVWRIFCAFTLYALGDYWSIFLGLLTYAAFTAVALICPSFPTLLTSAIVWGWGAAALWIASSTLILDATVKTRHGAASGYFSPQRTRVRDWECSCSDGYWEVHTRALSTMQHRRLRDRCMSQEHWPSQPSSRHWPR